MAAIVSKVCMAFIKSIDDLGIETGKEQTVINIKSQHDDSAIRLDLSNEAAVGLAVEIIKTQFEQAKKTALQSGEKIPGINSPSAFKVVHSSPQYFANINDLLDEVFGKSKKVSGL